MQVSVVINLILFSALSIAGFIIGRNKQVINARNKAWFVALRIFLIALICFAGWLKFHPEIEYYFIPRWFALSFEIIWIFPIAVFYASSASKVVSTRFASICAIFLSIILFLFALDSASWVIIKPRINQQLFNISQDGVCLQSTAYTCGAASAVTLLNCYNIPATESEMAGLSHTVTNRGIKFVPLALGIENKIKPYGFTTALLRLDWDKLKRLNQPCVIATKYGFMVDHVVALLGTEDDCAWIGDPLKGKVKWTKQEFLNKWRGTVILITQNSSH
jgi:predicted double-glycine peptidase